MTDSPVPTKPDSLAGRDTHTKFLLSSEDHKLLCSMLCVLATRVATSGHPIPGRTGPGLLSHLMSSSSHEDALTLFQGPGAMGAPHPWSLSSWPVSQCPQAWSIPLYIT